jgi:hypothetical protein
MLLNPDHSVYISIVPSIVPSVPFLNQLLSFFLASSAHASLVPLGAFFADPPLQNHAAPRCGSEHFGRVVRVLVELVRMCMFVRVSNTLLATVLYCAVIFNFPGRLF